jgi:hypothetical protein
MPKSKIVPRKVGGVKIPKRLRKLGNEALSNPMMREIVAGALIAIGTALASRAAQKGSSLRQAVEHPAESAKAARHIASGATSEIAGMAGAAAGSVAHLIEGLVGYLAGDAPPPKKKLRSKQQDKHSGRQRRREEHTARGDMH